MVEILKIFNQGSITIQKFTQTKEIKEELNEDACAQNQFRSCNEFIHDCKVAANF